MKKFAAGSQIGLQEELALEDLYTGRCISSANLEQLFVYLMERTMANQTHLKLNNGNRVAVIGGGPAGSFFSYFLLDMADRVRINLHVDVFERALYPLDTSNSLWIMNRDGSDLHKLADDAGRPAWGQTPAPLTPRLYLPIVKH